MAATATDITIEQGATFEKSIIVKDNAGAIINVSSWTGRGKVKTSATDTASIVDFVFDFSNGAAGEVKFSLTALVTDTIPTTGTKYSAYTKYVYDVELINGAKVYRAANGFANVSPSVTK